jgi:hypothetical protein
MKYKYFLVLIPFINSNNPATMKITVAAGTVLRAKGGPGGWSSKLLDIFE